MILLPIIGIIAFGCSKKDKTPTPNFSEYIAGYQEHSSGELVATLWVNGTPTFLTNGDFESTANDVALSNNDIYVAGAERDTPSPTDPTELNQRAVYWKNGTQMELTDGSTNAEATGIAVSGTDVYVAGSQYNASSLRFNARLWKNGVEVPLNDGSNWSRANDVAVSGSDVYVAGNETIAGTPTAILWVNGVAQPLSVPGSSGNAHRVLIVGNDIYVLGAYSNGGVTNACYWKNGNFNTIAFLAGGSSYFVNDGLLQSGNLHLVGYGFEASTAKPIYWNNGTAAKLGETSASAHSIVDKNNVLTVVGQVGEYPVKWENQNLAFTGTTKGSFSKIIYQ
jgi:hypothetical protein